MLRRLIRLPFLIVLLSPFALLAPVYATGKALFWGTPILQFVPWWAWSWRVLRSGQLPLWNPLSGMGAPLIANYQSGLFYPPNWIYFSLAEIGDVPLLAWGQAPLVAAHLAWAGLGMILLMRRLSLRPLAQMISGLSFGLSGYLVARSGFLSINAAVAWLPWVILLVTNWITNEKYGMTWREKGRRGTGKEIILLGIVIGMQLLSGHAQTTWYTLLLAIVWSAFLVFSGAGYPTRQSKKQSFCHSHDKGSNEVSEAQFLNRRFLSQPRDWLNQIAWIWGGIGLAILIAMAVAAVQLLPTAEYLSQSQRASEVDYELGMTYSFWPWRLVTLIAPDMFGNPVRGDYWGYANYWEDAIYIGLVPLLLAIGALIRGLSKRRIADTHTIFVRFLLVVLLVSILLALGTNTPIFPWLYEHVPTFDMFQAPTRFTIWAVFSLTVLAGFGAHYWQRPSGRGLYWTRLGTAGSAAVTIGAGLAWYIMGDISPTFIRATALAGVWGVAAGILTLLAPRFNIQPGVTSTAVMEDNQYRYDWWSMGVGLVVAADLVVAGWGLNPGIEMDVYEGESVSGTRVKALLNGGRIYLPEEVEYKIKFERFFKFDTFNPEEPWGNLRSTMLPNINLLDGIPSANNFDPLLNARYVQWMERLNHIDGQQQEVLLNLMDVQVVERMDNSSKGVTSLEPREAQPRFRWVPCAKTVENSNDAFEEVVGGTNNINRVVILEAEEEFSHPDCNAKGDGLVKDVFETPNNLTLQVRASRPGYLVIADQWYPGWRAYVDGKEVDILKANFLFRAVKLTAGDHEVMVKYRPISFYSGALISIVAWLGIGLYLVVRK